MANHKSTKKRIRQTIRRRARNRSDRSSLRSQITKLRSALSEGDKKLSETELQPTVALIDKMVNKRILHPNTAARYKSRLTRHVNALVK